MNTPTQQSRLIATTRHALAVMMICYIPHFFMGPWWLFFFIVTAVTYKLWADYFAYPLASRWIRLALVLLCLYLLKSHYGTIVSSGFYIGFLLVFIGLKCIEIHNFRDIKFLILCNYYLIFSALLINQDLWIIMYLFVAITANLSLMLRLAAPSASLKQIGSKSLMQLLIAIPLSIMLFYLFPRLASPLWQVPSLAQSKTGFSDRMRPGTLTELFSDDSTAMRITFKAKPIMNGYWRGLVLSFFDGKSWSVAANDPSRFPDLPSLSSNQRADYEVILEPHHSKWLFYLGTPKQGRPSLKFSSSFGLISSANEFIDQRFAYGLSVESNPFDSALTEKEQQQSTQLPRTYNPRLKAWSKEQFKQQKEPQAFIRFLQNYIQQNNYWYTLKPPALTSAHSMDEFWFDTQEGYCEHYAGAVAIILREVGIPARVIVGYQGGEWNPVAHYLTVQNNEAHAWVEYWQDKGWHRFDPTSFIAAERVDQEIKTLKSRGVYQSNESGIANFGFLSRAGLYLESARFFTERWLLFYNQEAQSELLEQLGLGAWGMEQLLRASVACILFFMVLLGLLTLWWQKLSHDPLLAEYRLLQKEFRRFNVPTPASATLKQQCRSLIEAAPSLAPTLSSFLYHYDQLRLRSSSQKNSKELTKDTLKLFKHLRTTLSQHKPSKRLRH